MAELLPSELPLIIKKELIKAEDRINKTRTPNVDQDVVGGMPTDKPDSTSIGETILDILCSQQFLKEWAKRLDDNKQNNLEFVGDKDGKVMKEGASKKDFLTDSGKYTSPSFILDSLSPGDSGLALPKAFNDNNPGLDISNKYSGFLYYEVQSNYSTGNQVLNVWGYDHPVYGTAIKRSTSNEWSKLNFFYGSENTYPDTNGFLKDRKSDLYALTNNKLTSDLNVDRTDYIASAKSAHDINKKAISAQNTANTAVTNASTAQNRADSAYALAEKKRDYSDQLFIGGASNVLTIETTAQNSYAERAELKIKNDLWSAELIAQRNQDYARLVVDSSAYQFPRNKSGEIAVVSDTAALGSLAWTGWYLSVGGNIAASSGGSLSYAIEKVPIDSVVCEVQVRGGSSNESRETRVGYRRIIRTGN